MSDQVRIHAERETPIERIFERVTGRKMTTQEKICFHLKRRIKPPPRANSNGHSHAAPLVRN